VQSVYRIYRIAGRRNSERTVEIQLAGFLAPGTAELQLGIESRWGPGALSCSAGVPGTPVFWSTPPATLSS